MDWMFFSSRRVYKCQTAIEIIERNVGREV
jgi:hypothetical protein